MDVELNPLEAKLLAAYKKQFNVSPDWAYPVAPPIPFVGDHYPANGGGVLIYASAENLGYTWDATSSTVEGWKHHLNRKAIEWPWFENDLSQMVRGRMMLKREGGTRIHIEPINNGGLLKVARHILQYACPTKRFSEEPVAFLQQIAVANPGKFSIRPNDGETAVNYDYAGPKHWKKFQEQIQYIAADLSALEPLVLIVPTTILRSLRRSGLWGSVQAHQPECIISIRQVQPRAIVRKHGPRIPTEGDRALPDGYGSWAVPDCADTYVRWMIENADRIGSNCGRIEL